ncbi:hypothetical protein C9426_09300 [Serratia sp. S1B]|nr:hypothetical protein C9426_09300 [Serratia sp. S1B]
MKISLGRSNGIVLSVIVGLIIVLVATWLNSWRDESLRTMTVVLVGALFGMLGGVAYDSILFNNKDIEKITCMLLPAISGGILIYVSQFNKDLVMMLLVISTLILLGLLGGYLKRHLSLTNSIALAVGIFLLIISAVIIYNRFRVPDDYWPFGIGMVIIMMSLGGVWIKDYILIQLGVNRGEK